MKDCKRGNTNTVQEANVIITETSEAVLHEKKKSNKQKLKCCETEAFCDPNIVDSYSENELYRIGSINLEDSGKDPNKWWLHKSRGGYPTENYNVNKIDKEIECNLLKIILRPVKRAKTININYSTNLYGYMNTHNGRARFNNLQGFWLIWCQN